MPLKDTLPFSFQYMFLSNFAFVRVRILSFLNNDAGER